jgi:hypothetical protein
MSRLGHRFGTATSWRAHTYKPAVSAAGLDPALRFHDLRHTCAPILIANGADDLMQRLDTRARGRRAGKTRDARGARAARGHLRVVADVR